MDRDRSDDMPTVLREHLARWGLRRFDSDEAYFQWQRQTLSSAELADLHRAIELKRRGPVAEDVAFYDATAASNVLPVLQSQRYDYYQAVGFRVAGRLGPAEAVLDVGCGPGILTTFYASLCPDKVFVGVDRSARSIERAQKQAQALGLTNVRFDCLDVAEQPLLGRYDLIVATHALVQSEHDSGIPSRDWTTFERARDPEQQSRFESRTGLGLRLDRLVRALSPSGRMIVFEKTRQLARRVPLQRAFAARGLRPAEEPEPVRYRLVEEVADDGPLYVLTNGQGSGIGWDESPEPDEGPPFDSETLRQRPSDPETPLYENHWPSAQRAWESLRGKQVLKDTTRREPDGRQLHVELGQAEGLAYLYCSNTFDQRQVVLFPIPKRGMLDAHYAEIIRALPSA